jgi:DNA-binding protein HU-beta
MTKTQLQLALAEATQTNKKTAGVFLDTLSALAYKTTKKTGQFVLRDFGKLVKQKRKARTGFNPKTLKKIRIPAKTVLKFRVAKVAKARGSVADRCKYLLCIHLRFKCAVIGMNPPLPFVPVVPRLVAWLAVTHLVIHSFVNVGSRTTLSSPVYGPARRGRCGVGPEDRKRSVRCSRKLRHGLVLYMEQHAGGVNLAPICNRSAIHHC